jgi:MYXO-CTERM domain-containing protein
MLLSGLVATAVMLRPDALALPPVEPAEIYGGVVSAPGAWPTAVAINAGTILCTGTLVSPNVVLTAAHCLVNNPPIESVYVRFGNDVNQPDSPLVFALTYGAHPEFCGEDSCTEDIHDYGYIVLSQPQSITPTRVITSQDDWDEVMEVGQKMTLVGYGLADGGTVTGIKREVEVDITRFSKSGLEFQGGGDGKDSCQGDSGGPAFITLTSGEVVLGGVTSRGYSCGKGGFYAVPYGGLCWLKETAGLDLSNGCALCDCVDTDPNRKEGCGCRSDAPMAPGGWLLLALVFGWSQARKRSLSSRTTSSSSSSSSSGS